MTIEHLLKEISRYQLVPSDFLDTHIARCLRDDSEGSGIGSLFLAFPTRSQCRIWTDQQKGGLSEGLRFRIKDGGGRSTRTFWALSLIIHILENDLKFNGGGRRRFPDRSRLTRKIITDSFFKKFQNIHTNFGKLFKFEGLVILRSETDGDMNVWFENWGTGLNCWDNELLFNAFVILGYAMQEDTKWRDRPL